jgi:hypothetical protein
VRAQHSLRAVAVAIVLVAAADPSFTRTRTVREPLSVVGIGAESSEAAARVQERLSSFSPRLSVAPSTARAAACPREGGCVLVSAGELPTHVTAGAHVIGGVWVAPDGTVIRHVEAPQHVHLDAPASLSVTVDRDARVELFDGSVLLGAADARAGRSAQIDWVPLAPGARRLRLVAGDESVDVAVLVTPGPVSIAMVEPEPTWLGTFVRRALEEDGRFVVTGRTEAAPSVGVTRGEVRRITPAGLRDALAVFLTAPDALRPSEAALLDEYVRHRGGSLVVLLDRRPAGRSLQWLPSIVEEHVQAEPTALGALRAREFLVFGSGPGTAALAGITRPAIVQVARGRGAVVVSGAMDAWRYRDESRTFDRFWGAVAWEAATAAGPPLRVGVDPLVVSPGEEAAVRVEVQEITADVSNVTAAAAVAVCDGRTSAVRLWPEARPGAFRGTVQLDQPGECELQVRVGERTSSTAFLVAPEVRRDGSLQRFEGAVRAHGARVIAIDQLDELAIRISQTLPPRTDLESVHPMRSPLWLVPLAATLGVEWWMRRRAGLR